MVLSLQNANHIAGFIFTPFMDKPISVTPALTIEVDVATESIDRDSIKHNVAVLEIAAKTLGLRVGVNTCIVHVSALYQLMQIPVARHFAYYWRHNWCDGYSMSVVIY